MLEKPDLADELITSCLQAEYNLRVVNLTFLPLGADLGTAVYRVVTDNGDQFFLKLRRGFDEIAVTVPLLLKSQGIEAIIPPIETLSKQYWVDFGKYTMILFPFIEGKNGFEMQLTGQQRQELGGALKKMHTLQIPAELKERVPIETFDPRWRQILRGLQRLVRVDPFDDLTAAKLAEFMQARERQISELVKRAEMLAEELQFHPLEFVLCHADIHGGNLLMSSTGQLYIVDWDTLVFAPKERDLMFIGAGVDNLWRGARQLAMFYQGYGKVNRNLTALAYYRYERIIQDLAVIGEQLLLTDEGGADREQSLGWFTKNFELRGTIHIARVTDILGHFRR